jgi:hypothetical protein
MLKAKEALADRLLTRLKNNPWVAWSVVAGTVILAVVSFAKGIQEAGNIFGQAFASQDQAATFDAATKESLLSAAHDVDAFFIEIEFSDGRVYWKDVIPKYINIEASLRSIELRNTVRPLNEISQQQSELLLKQWDDVGKLLRVGMNKNTAEEAYAAMLVSFQSMLVLEEAKHHAK